MTPAEALKVTLVPYPLELESHLPELSWLTNGVSYGQNQDACPVKTFVFNTPDWRGDQDCGMYVVKFEEIPVAFIEKASFWDNRVHIVDIHNYYRLVAYIVGAHANEIENVHWYVADAKMGSEILNASLSKWFSGEYLEFKRESPSATGWASSAPR